MQEKLFLICESNPTFSAESIEETLILIDFIEILIGGI